MFNVGDRVVMAVHTEASQQFEDDYNIPIGALGTIISHIHDDRDDEPAFLAVDWDEEHETTYSREFWSDEYDSYIDYAHVWCVSQECLQLLNSGMQQNLVNSKVIRKIQAIDEKFKRKQLHLRKITPMPFPKGVIA